MWNLKASEHLTHWRDFRKSLAALPLDTILTKVIKFWHGCPFSPYYLDPERPANWPDPWTLIQENYYCDVAKALGIVYTLSLLQREDILDLELHVYVDPETKYQYNAVCINRGKYILNLIDDEVLNKQQIKKSLTLKHRYTATDLNLDNYK